MASRALPATREQTGNALLDRQESQRNQIANTVNRLPIPPEAYLAEKVVVTAGQASIIIPHRLRRAWTGWIVTRVRAGQTWGLQERANDETDLDKIQLRLRNDAGGGGTSGPACTFDILIW